MIKKKKKKVAAIEQIPGKEAERTFTREDLKKCAAVFIDQHLGRSHYGPDRSEEREEQYKQKYEGLRTTIYITGIGMYQECHNVPVNNKGEIVREGMELIYHTWFTLGGKAAWYRIDSKWIIRFNDMSNGEYLHWKDYLALKGITGTEVSRPTPKEQRVYKKKKGEKVLVTRKDNHTEF